MNSLFTSYDPNVVTKQDDAILLEFKVINPRREKSLEDTVKEALRQIEEKNMQHS